MATRRLTIEVGLIIPLVAALAAIVGSALTYFIAHQRLPMERKTVNANAAAALTKAASDLVCDLRDELVRINQRVVELERINRSQTHEIATMRQDLIKASNRIHNLEEENKHLRQQNHELVFQLATEQDKRRALEEKLQQFIDNGRAGGV